ncbi:protein yellow-like [Cloeon dipterum]|uniref:protein yellow-like n=1 Tax=Cloeon dipterum TaxID=197152 RepID=UPI0032208BE2
MNSFAFVIILLQLSLANAANFTQVFEWPDGMDYEWPSEASRTNALNERTFKPENIQPRYMAVYGTRIFLSLYRYGIPATLVSLPTSSASSASPKLTPVPSWDMHGEMDCNKIQAARGLEVDSIGRLWVLDNGSENCKSKLWTIDLVNNDHTEVIHRFPFPFYYHYSINDLVLDETPNETLAYISWRGVIVFSLERNQSWIVDTPGIKVDSIALSPKEEPRQLYLGKRYSNELYSISVSALRNGTRTANLQLIGRWTEKHNAYRMLMNNHGTIYTAFLWRHDVSSYNTSQPFQEQRFHDFGDLMAIWPFTFALDSSGTFWMTEKKGTAYKSKFRLLKAAVGAESYMSEPPKTDGRFTGKRQIDYSALIGSLALLLVFSCIVNLWFTLRMRNSKNSNEQRNAGAEEMELPTALNHVSTEMEDEEPLLR